jgi:hypothetical protein
VDLYVSGLARHPVRHRHGIVGDQLRDAMEPSSG